jgi:hypothetical protein
MAVAQLRQTAIMTSEHGRRSGRAPLLLLESFKYCNNRISREYASELLAMAGYHQS